MSMMRRYSDEVVDANGREALSVGDLSDVRAVAQCSSQYQCNGPLIVFFFLADANYG